MFRNLFVAAVLAALCAGLINSAIQHFRVTPLILHAESFEGEAHTHDAATPAHSHDEDAWAPQDGGERTAYTVLANLLLAAGFALVIGAISLLFNLPITFANGALWGLAGFLVFSLAPAYGLAPGLPGMPTAEVLPRQVWWWATVISTGAAVLLLAKTRAGWAFALAAVLVAAPHIVGAPQPPDEHTSVPAQLAIQFATAALGTAAVFWLVLGLVFGRLNDMFAARKTT
jgi:cobalt transporter subunit CbtA